MKKAVVAFDVDGTLRCNCTDTCQDANPGVIAGLVFFGRMKNTHIMIWSGGGADYARNFMETKIEVLKFGYGIKNVHYASKLDPSTWKWGKPDISIDDQQAFDMATINLIVREK